MELIVLLLVVIVALIGTNVWIWQNAQAQLQAKKIEGTDSQTKIDQLVNNLRFSTERILQANERRYRALFENNNDAILIADLAGKILVANERSSDLLQVDLDDLLQTNLIHFFRHEADKEKFRQDILNKTSFPLYECELVCADGSFIFVEVNQALVKDTEGVALQLQIILRDITARKQAEVQLSQERNLLRIIIDSIPDAVFATDYGGRYIVSNKAHYTSLSATSVAEVIGKTPHDFFAPDIATIFAREDMSVAQTGKPLHIELPEETPDGNSIWRDITKVPFTNEQNDVVGVVGIIRNITDSKRVAENLESVISQLNLLHDIDNEINSTLHLDYLAASALDTVVRLSRADAGFIAVLKGGVMKLTSSIGNYDVDTKNYRLREYQGITGRVLLQQKPELILDVSQDPDYRANIDTTQALMAIPLISQDQLVGLISLETSRPQYFSADVFEFVKLVAARISGGIDNARLYDMLQNKLEETELLYQQTDVLYREKSHLEQLKTDMIRIASHDLKNPLSIIKGYISIIQMNEQTLSEENLEYITEIEKASRRMEKILEDILSLEKISQRAIENYVEFDLKTQVEHAFSEFSPQAKNKNQEIKLHCDFSVMPIVKGDESQIYEAITNLIGNAIKYTPDGGHVDVYMQISATEQIIFKVVDTGYGIPEDMQESLFKPFYRAKTEETRTIEGTGLGLHLVKNIIERHNGKMLFSSEYGKGSTFGFELPLV